MGLLGKIFKGRSEESGPDLPVTLDVAARRAQLQALEDALDELSARMRDREELMANPGWRARTQEYDRVAGSATLLRKGTPTREALLDLSFEVRPVFNGPVPDDLQDLVPLQDKALTAARGLQELLPGERG